jgi:hypothetical protein
MTEQSNKGPLIKSLIKAKQGFSEIVKDKANPYFKSKYADLSSILAAIDKPLLENGLFVSQVTSTLEDGTAYLTTQVWHESGEVLESPRYLLHGGTDPQKLGSAITYARRYQLCALLSIAADDDDDGNGMSYSSKKTSANPKVANIKQASKNPNGKKILDARTASGMPKEEVAKLLGGKKPDDLTPDELGDVLDLIGNYVRPKKSTGA